MADRFYVPDPPAEGEITLAGPEAHHMIAVRRFAPGDRVTLFCGDGREYPAGVVAAGKKTVTLNVAAGEIADREVGFRLEFAVAMPKGDRGDFLVEKLTELGATRFTPLVTSRTIVQPKAARVENLQRAVIEAAKPGGRNILMRVDAAEPWDRVRVRPDLPPLRLILHAAGRPVSTFADRVRTGVIFAVGPEGGFTPAEVECAEGWELASLGPRILRVETAAVAAAAWTALT